MSKERHNSVEDESEIESKVVTVGSNQGYKALMIVMVALLVGGVYYLYFSPSNKEGPEIVKKEETKQNIQELKGKLEQVPDNVVVSERIATDLLPPLPPLPIPQVIPEVKQIKKRGSDKKRRATKRNSLVKYTCFTKAKFSFW